MKIRQLKQKNGTIVLQIGRRYKTDVKGPDGCFIYAVRWHNVPTVYEVEDVDFDSLQGEILGAKKENEDRRRDMKRAAEDIKGLELS